MASKLHPTAIIDKNAELAPDVEVGPFSVIGPGVKIGAGTVIANHVTIQGHSEIGERNVIGTSAVLGAPAQVRGSHLLKNAGLKVGRDNIIREFVTMHTASKEDGHTVVGDRNFIMANCHVAHDCIIGNDVTMANLASLSGHVRVEDQVVIGGMVGVHQFVKIGRLAMIGGVSRVIMDVPPFSMCSGHPAKICGINSVGLRRAGYSSKEAMTIRHAIRMLFRSSGSLAEAVERVRVEFKGNTEIEHLIAFVETSERGLPREMASVRDDR